MIQFPMEKPPDISPESTARINDAATAIMKMPDAERARVRLSLRWFNAALRDAAHDAFVKFWIAVETLAMPSSTNILPIFESLARAYGISVPDAKTRFPIGRLFDLRGRIVHKGEMLELPGAVLGYMSALFFDLLSELLLQPNEGRLAESLRASPPERLIPKKPKS